MPDPPIDTVDGCNRNRSEKTYIQKTVNYNSHGTSHPTSTYSTPKDFCRNYSNIKDSTSLHNSSNNYSILKNKYKEPLQTIDYRKNDFKYCGSPERKIADCSTDSYRKYYMDSFLPLGNIDFIDEDIPYHARQTSQPFSYGATTDMIKHQKLSSPSLVRKTPTRNIAPAMDFEDIPGEQSKRLISPLSSSAPYSSSEYMNGSTRSVMDHMDG